MAEGGRETSPFYPLPHRGVPMSAMTALDRRAFLGVTTAAVAGLAARGGDDKPAGAAKKPTTFQIACMTLPYSRFPLERALKGLQAAGYRYVAWGTTHQEAGGKRVPVLAGDAPVGQAKELGKRCRD